MNESITGLNSKIAALSEILQKSRIVLKKENQTFDFISDMDRRIVLLCLLYIFAYKECDKAIPHTLLDLFSQTGWECIQKDWFGNGHGFSTIHIEATISSLQELAKWQNGLNLLAYAYEVLEYNTTEYSIIGIKRRDRDESHKKKRQGIYYTPSDVIHFMVSRCVKTLNVAARGKKPSFLDCSCGTGVFLLEVLKRLEEIYNARHDFDISLHLLIECIWGIDISQNAIDSCKTVFASYYIENYPFAAHHMSEVWNVLCNCFYVGDAAELGKVISKKEHLPHQFDCVIGNPPYVTLGRSSNLYITFVKNMMEYSSEISCSALVLPLSVCYSQGQNFIDLRKKIKEDYARWEFHNYDRSPDSLFGDQVKTRSTIAFRIACRNRKEIYTTKLQRWTSKDRAELFKQIQLCHIFDVDIKNGIPKISTDDEREAFLRLSKGRTCLSDMIPGKTENRGGILILNGTAYNWICAYDHIPASSDENGNPYLSSTCTIHSFQNESDRDFCIAILSNRITYWYWTTIGDGFHLNSSFLSDYRVGKGDFSQEQYKELCQLGKAYSERVKKSPVVSVNAGKVIINYSHWEAMDIIKKIEIVLQDALRLPTGFCDNLESWYNDQVQCNRKKQRGK